MNYSNELSPDAGVSKNLFFVPHNSLAFKKKLLSQKFNFVCSNNNLISIATRKIRREPQFYKERLIFRHANRGARELKNTPLRQKRRKLN